MRISTDLLFRWLRAAPSGIPDGVSHDLQIPNALMPVVEVPGPLRDVLALVGTDVQRESFAFSLLTNVAASQAEASIRVCTFGRGLWLVNFSLVLHTDFTAAPGTNSGGAVLITDGRANSRRLARLPSIANAAQAVQMTYRLLFADNLWFFELLTGATGVGQTLSASVDGSGVRLN